MPIITHEDTHCTYRIPYVQNVLPPFDFKDYLTTVGVIAEMAEARKNLRIVGDSGCGKSFSLLSYAYSNHHAVYIELGAYQNPQSLMTKLAEAIGLRFETKCSVDKMQQILIDNLQNRRELVYLIDEADFLCPANKESILPTLKCIRFIWQYTNIPFILASTYELETRLQNNRRGESTAQFYRRTGYKQMKGISESEAYAYLAQIEKEFPVAFDAGAKRVYADRMLDSSHSGLAKTVEAVEQTFQKVFKPVFQQYKNALLTGSDRMDALKLFENTETVHISEAEANSSLKYQK